MSQRACKFSPDPKASQTCDPRHSLFFPVVRILFFAWRDRKYNGCDRVLEAKVVLSAHSAKLMLILFLSCPRRFNV